jgi:hypothetical protein
MAKKKAKKKVTKKKAVKRAGSRKKAGKRKPASQKKIAEVLEKAVEDAPAEEQLEMKVESGTAEIDSTNDFSDDDDQGYF